MDTTREVPARFVSLPVRRMFGVDFPVAEGLLARTRGLALIELEKAGLGLYIPRCRSVHTFGMRFPVDLVFLDGRGVCISFRPAVRPARFVLELRADSVLETPVGLLSDRLSATTVPDGGEKGRPGT